MSLFELIILAFGLSMDSFAISIANGMLKPDLKFKKALFMAIAMGSFHVLMPLAGYYFAHFINDIVREIDHWIAFILLGFIGGRMIWESIRSNNNNEEVKGEIFSFPNIIIQSFATSIDALVIGISLGFLQIPIFKSATIIGTITFLMVMIGLKAGIVIGARLGKKMEFLGGLVLILIGFKTLMQHLFF